MKLNEFSKRAKGDTPVDLVWEDFTDDHLSVRPELCKNGRRSGQGRVIDLGPVLKEWIEFIRLKKGGVLTGSIQPKNWTKHWLAWRKKHWIDSERKPIPWAKDQLRHSFGSYHLARGKDLGVTSFIMENSPKILKKHYWNWKTLGAEAAIYWDLSPSRVLGNKAEESTTPVLSD